MNTLNNMIVSLIEIGVGVPGCDELGDVLLYKELLFVQWSASNNAVLIGAKESSRSLLLTNSRIFEHAFLPADVVCLKFADQVLFVNCRNVSKVAFDRHTNVMLTFVSRQTLGLRCACQSSLFEVIGNLIPLCSSAAAPANHIRHEFVTSPLRALTAAAAAAAAAAPATPISASSSSSLDAAPGAPKQSRKRARDYGTSRSEDDDNNNNEVIEPRTLEFQ